MNKLQIPAWLIATAVLVLIVVVLERLYHAKVPVKIFGIELNQPTVAIPGIELRLRSAVSAKSGETKVLGIKENEGFCYLTSVSGDFRAADEYARVYVDNGVWTLQLSRGSGSGIYATAQCVEYSPK